MATKPMLRVTCDVCGRMEDIDGSYSPWFKKMWVKIPEYNTGMPYEYVCKELDICEKCLEKALRIRFDGYEYTIED